MRSNLPVRWRNLERPNLKCRVLDLFQKTLHPLLAITGHPRHNVNVDSGLQGVEKTQSVDLIKQILREANRRTAHLLEAARVVMRFRVEIVIGEDLINHAD